jgi:hypothetical protein
MIILVAHFCACLWYIIGYEGLKYENCWIKDQNLVNAEWDVLYVFHESMSSSLHFIGVSSQ